jgi:indolepyruvate ferredoxin oxidoreductase
MTTTTASDHMVRLEDRYELEEGRVFLSGVQALVRVLLDQHRADTLAGLHTGIFASGYQGSPLGGFDRELAGLRGIAAEHDLVHRPAVNEELGATSVWGSQIAGTLPGMRYDGIVGVWYGKAPGVDRAADAIRHGNFIGTDPRGGVLALCGDDPECKSSTLPSASEGLLAALEVPVLVPGSVQEALDLGRHAIACSRASGLWSGLKVVTAVADGTATAEVGPGRVVPVMPELEWEGSRYVHRPSSHALAPQSLEMERTLRGVRLELARRYARVNDLNRIVAPAPDARVGIVASGVAYHQLRQALVELGLADGFALRILKVGMPFPLDDEIVRSFAAGLDEVIVVEEKGPFLERLVKDALYGTSHAPVVVGKGNPSGRSLLPATGILSPDVIGRAVGERVLLRDDLPAVRARLDQIDAVLRRGAVDVGATRTPFFCSGCPHNISTKAPEDSVVGAGIGCHTLVMLGSEGRGELHGLTQMGGEGAQWLGVAPFIEPRHFLQNLGDGTYHHSGSLAIRAAVAGGLHVTFKLLYNSTVAMTGGQHPEGQMTVPALAQELEAEGVERIIVTTDEPERYQGVSLPSIAEVRHRRKLAASQRELSAVPGVTVLIHDQPCATELRRARKRGKAPTPDYEVIINERVCEGCGDCGEKSSCLSLEPVETEFGRKTRIDQGSCNKDRSCIEGDCPSFMRVIRAESSAGGGRGAPALPAASLPEPRPRVPADGIRLRIVGIGGTGVVTVSQVLGVAAMLDGAHAAGLDQTGLSQKAGPVVSDLQITRGAPTSGVNLTAGSADLLLGFDVLATTRNLAAADAGRTVAIVSSSVVPTAGMVVDVLATGPDTDAAVAAIEQVTRSGENVFLPARELATTLFGDPMAANVLLLGAAWQQGTIPLSHDAIRRAFELNKVAVEQNLAAFEWGRAAVAAPELVEQVLDPASPPPELSSTERELVDAVTREQGELRRRVEIRVADLVGWGGRRPARRYAQEIRRVAALEGERVPGSTAFTEAVAVGLHKLMAYKDEYEVARLHVEEVAKLPEGSKVTLMLHPPMLRSMGLNRKLALGPWFLPVMRLLARGRRLRGTPLDPFGRAAMRRLERALPAEYLELVDRALGHLSAGTLPTAVRIAELPDGVRGYEEIKLRGVERMRKSAEELLRELARSPAEPAALHLVRA